MISKLEVNEILYHISIQKPDVGTALKTLYIYGTNMKILYDLKVKDIDFEENTIQLYSKQHEKKITRPLDIDLKDELIELIYSNNLGPEDYALHEPEQKVNAWTQKFNRYIRLAIRDLNNTKDYNLPKLTTREFKILRGQHLFIDGVPVKIIREILDHDSENFTRKLLQTAELNEQYYSKITADKVFSDYTDINVFTNECLEPDLELYTVMSYNAQVLLEYYPGINKVELRDLYEDESLAYNEKAVRDLKLQLELIPLDELIPRLKKLEPGQFKRIHNLKFIRN